MLWYSLEVPPQGASNEYHNISFCGEKRKISTIFCLKSTLSGAMNAYSLEEKKEYTSILQAALKSFQVQRIPQKIYADYFSNTGLK